MQPQDLAKRAAGAKAASLIKPGMKLGLGTGSTAHAFISALIERTLQGLHVSAVCTSEQTRLQAEKGGIKILAPHEIGTLDLTVDGADEIDPQFRMIKGGGGALLREKIIASLSKEMTVIVDETKVVEKLGSFPLPVEIIPFAHEAIARRLAYMGYTGCFREKDESIFMTDNGNYILDIPLTTNDIVKVEREISALPGVVETGFFFGYATRLIIGKDNGDVEVKEASR